MGGYKYSGGGGGGGGGAAPELGWRRFLLDDATWTEDTLNQHGSISEDATKTTWTSAASITINTGSQHHIPNQGSLYGIELTDANGDSLRWDKPWQCHFLIETLSTRSALKNTDIYYGFGLSAFTSGLDSTQPCLGEAVAWDLTSSSNYQREVIFRRNSQSTSNQSEDYDMYGAFRRGPKYTTKAAHWQIVTFPFDPSAPATTAANAANVYGQSPVTTATSGAVYAFVTCGLRGTISSAVSADFRIWYSVTGAADWSPA